MQATPAVRLFAKFRMRILATLAVVAGVGIAVACSHSNAVAQTETLNEFRPRAFAIVGAKLVTKPGTVIENGTLVIRDGLIAAVGADVAAPSDAEVIDGKQLVVYAGFIDAGGSHLIDPAKPPTPQAGKKVDFSRYALAAMQEDNRRGLTPDFLAHEALKLEPATVEALRKLGITDVHTIPSGRIASGSGVLISTSSAPLRDSVVRESTLAELQLFAPGRGGGQELAYPLTLMGSTAHLKQAFLDAERYAKHWKLYRDDNLNIERPPHDAVLEQLGGILGGGRRAIMLADTRDDIHRALDFCQDAKFATTLWGAREAYRCIDRLKEMKVDVILDVEYGEEPKVEPQKPSAKLEKEVKDPQRAQEDRLNRWKEQLAGAAELQRQGVRFAFGSRGLKKQTDFLKNVRQVVSHGLPADAALAALTTDAAAILDTGDRLGALEPGKLAHVVVLTGPFENEQSKVRYVFLDGEKFEYNADAKPVSPGATDAPKINIAGRWQLGIESADGTVAATLDLKQDGYKVSGSFSSEQGDGRLTSGTVTNDGAEFVVAIGAGARVVELKFSAKLEGEKLTGDLKPAFGAVTKWSAAKLEGDEKPGENPVQLTLSDDADEKKADDKPSDDAKKEGPVEAPLPAVELPTELRSDRLNRSIVTQGNAFIKNATVLTSTGQTLTETSISIQNGKISAIGRDLTAAEGAHVIDATGLFVMPGIIDTHSHIMITSGINEASLSIVPEVRVRSVVNSDDASEYRALAGGVTTARLLHGSANVVGGQDAVVKLKYGKTAHEHILHDAPQGVKFALGENVKFRTNRFPNTRMGVEATLNRAFLEAVDYRRVKMEYEKQIAANPDAKLLPPRRDLRLEALADIVNHEKFIHSHCYRADEILMLLRVASNLGIRVWSLQHVLEGYKVAPEIVAHGASCSTFSDWWAYKVEAYDAIPYNAALLKQAGANVTFKSDDAELMRHMYCEAAKAVRYGNVDPEDAIQMITLNGARELGLDERIGSIEVGKDADLAIFNAHPLSAFTRCEMTLIEGEVYFHRETMPTAMSAVAAKNSAHPRTFELPTEDIRAKPVDLAISPNGSYAIVGATLHPVDGPEIAAGVLLIADGKITAVGGGDVAIPSDAKKLDATGLHVYPGMIDSGTTLGLIEIGKVVETQDFAEGGKFQPDVRAGVALNPDSELIPVARSGGITAALIHPSGGLVAGQASLAKLSGWTSPDLIVNLEAGMQIEWPIRRERGITVRETDESSPQEEPKDDPVDELKEFFKQARLYDQLRKQAEDSKQPGPIVDPRLEAMRPYLSKQKPVFIEADSRRQIAEALLFAEEEKINIVITGGADAWKLADELKKRDVPVIVGPVMRRPIADYDPFDAPYANPGRLHEAGVKFCIRSNEAASSRNAPFEAAMAVAYGLPEDVALRSVTLAAAEILGVAETLGSLTVNKSATLIITDGTPLRQTTHIKGVFIDGKPFTPENRQTRFYERYLERLREVKPDSSAVTAGEE